MRMTYGIAYSFGLEAANLQMRQAGRAVWSKQDAELAAAMLHRHFPLCAEVQVIQPVLCGCPAWSPHSQPSVQGLLWA